MCVFVTGATGYIGERLTEKLLADGYEVHCFGRREPNAHLMTHKALRFFKGELSDTSAIHQAMETCEAVFHLAAIAKVYLKDRTEYYDVNVSATVNLLEVAMQTHVKKFVFTSSAAVYGVSDKKPLTEDSVRTTPFFTDYEASKFIAEERILHYVQKGLHVVIVHPTKVYGPGSWSESNAVSRMVQLYLKGKWHIIPGDGKMIGNFSFVDDVVSGHILAMQKGKSGEKYILGGENLSFNALFALIKELSGKNFRTVHIPYALMMLFGWLEEVLAIFGKTPKITRPWIKKYNHDLALSSGKAHRDLGYVITPIEMGLMQTIQWLEKEM